MDDAEENKDAPKGEDFGTELFLEHTTKNAATFLSILFPQQPTSSAAVVDCLRVFYREGGYAFPLKKGFRHHLKWDVGLEHIMDLMWLTQAKRDWLGESWKSIFSGPSGTLLKLGLSKGSLTLKFKELDKEYKDSKNKGL
jgi:hypothetical protein